jgi:hypothetical protein
MSIRGKTMIIAVPVSIVDVGDEANKRWPTAIGLGAKMLDGSGHPQSN